MTSGLLAVAVFVFAFSMVARRLQTTLVTAPMVFIGLGFLLSKTQWLPLNHADAALHLVAEITLVVFLFLDAAKTDLNALKKQHGWPVRMLSVGMPLAIVLGALVAWPFLPQWPVLAVILVAAVLAPTDAALGQAVVNSPIVPQRVRRALTVESGLNDGLALPIILLFASLVAAAAEQDMTKWIWFGVAQLTLGPLVGAIVGYGGGRILLAVFARRWTSAAYEGSAALALAAAAYLGATFIGGNGFVAAFVAGLCFGQVIDHKCDFIYEFTESEGRLLSWAAFLLIGYALVPKAVAELDMAMLAVILLSLLIVRPLAILVSLIGTDASFTTRLFLGWFGPRGLATALFALLIVERLDKEMGESILALATNAVWISALLHGVTAAPAARWYAKKIKEKGDCPETQPVAISSRKQAEQ